MTGTMQAPAREPYVTAQVNRLSNKAEELEKLSAALRERLQAIVRVLPPQPPSNMAPKQTGESIPPLAERLSGIASALDRSLQFLQDIHDNCEL